MLTLARAAVTLREGRLITKREALDMLTAMAAPADVVADIRRRRYAAAQHLSAEQLARRGGRAAAFVRSGIDRALGR